MGGLSYKVRAHARRLKMRAVQVQQAAFGHSATHGPAAPPACRLSSSPGPSMGFHRAVHHHRSISVHQACEHALSSSRTRLWRYPRFASKFTAFLHVFCCQEAGCRQDPPHHFGSSFKGSTSVHVQYWHIFVHQICIEHLETFLLT